MADKKISELVECDPLDGTEDLPIVQDGVTVRCSTQDIADLANGLPYSLYAILFNQSGTSNPTAVVLANDLGGTPTLTRSLEGWYAINLTGAFPVNKTFINGVSVDGSSDGYVAFPIIDTAIRGYYHFRRTGVSGDEISILFMDESFVSADYSAVMGGTSKLAIEIKVYP